MHTLWEDKSRVGVHKAHDKHSGINLTRERKRLYLSMRDIYIGARATIKWTVLPTLRRGAWRQALFLILPSSTFGKLFMHRAGSATLQGMGKKYGEKKLCPSDKVTIIIFVVQSYGFARLPGEKSI